MRSPKLPAGAAPIWSSSAVAVSADFSTVFVRTSTSSSVPHPARYSCFRNDEDLKLLSKLAHCLRDLAAAIPATDHNCKEFLAPVVHPNSRHARIRSRGGLVTGRY